MNPNERIEQLEISVAELLERNEKLEARVAVCGKGAILYCERFERA